MAGLTRSAAAALIGWIMLLVVGLWAFGLVARTALGSRVDAFDLSVTDQLHGLASPLLQGLMRELTGFGSTVFLAAVVGVVVIVLMVRGDHAGACLLAVAMIGTLTLNESLKVFFARPRPAFDWAEPISGSSFPSGHAMNAFVVYVSLGLIAGRAWGLRAGVGALSLSLVITTIVGLSRVYLGAHWATDVAGGVLAGALFLLILVPAWLVARRAVAAFTPP